MVGNVTIGLKKMSQIGKKIAIVIPWFGRNLRGGAERHAWELATRLAARGRIIEVITTCCRAHQDDWETNHFEAGLSQEPEGFTVRRFRVVARDRGKFDQTNAKLMAITKESLRRGISPLTLDHEAVFTDELMRSPELLDHLWVTADDYTAFLFLPYLYFTTLRGLPLVADKSILIPCLHHESYAFMERVAEVFRKARRILFISEGERRLAGWMFGPNIAAKGVFAGAGIEFEVSTALGEPTNFSALQPFVLCLGRQDPGKNTDFLVRAYSAFRARATKSKLKLVLAGPGSIDISSDAVGVVDLGAVSEANKVALLKSCEALFNPSVNESYSRVIMEAWHFGRPVVVNRDCLATATAVTPGENGWLAASLEEWSEAFERVSSAGARELDRLGEIGRLHANDVGNWDRAISRYEKAIDECLPTVVNVSAIRRSKIYQVLPNLAFGDAISNEAIWIKHFLRRAGYESEILALHVDPKVRNEAIVWTAEALESDAMVLYHHSIGSPLTTEVCSHKGPKALIYHNITPEHFLVEYLPLNSVLCREARAQLPELAKYFPISVGDSVYNAIELSELGFTNPGVLPICVDPSKWSMLPDPVLMRRLEGTNTNILFVGRLSPNKRHEDLLIAFAHYRLLDPTARLHLVGSAGSPGDLYEACLRSLVRELGILESVNFTGTVGDASLAAYYATADLFWSMSEHEGFCVPLIEAMWFDVPVFAFAAGAVPETLAGAGSLFVDKTDSAGLARQAFDLVHDPLVREALLARQRIRREAFLPASVETHVIKLIERIDLLSKKPVQLESQLSDIEVIREIAVVKLDHIGDLLLASPVFFSLAMRFPGVRLTAVVAPSAAKVLENNPYVYRIITYDPPWYWRELGDANETARKMATNREAIAALSAMSFDLVVNLRSDHANVLFAASLPHRHLLSYTNDSPYSFLISRPLTRIRAMHVSSQHRELLRSIGADAWCDPTVYCSDINRERARLLGKPTCSTVVLALGAGVPLKRWSPVKFRELARRLHQKGVPLAIVGSAADAELCADWAADYNCLDLCGQFDLLDLVAYLTGVGCVVANDSAPMHLGAAAGIPVVYIMRPPVREEFEPIGSRHIGCTLARCDQPCKGFDPNDRNGTPDFCRCIQSVTVDEVESAVLGLMRSATDVSIGRESALATNHELAEHTAADQLTVNTGSGSVVGD